MTLVLESLQLVGYVQVASRSSDLIIIHSYRSLLQFFPPFVCLRYGEETARSSLEFSFSAWRQWLQTLFVRILLIIARGSLIDPTAVRSILSCFQPRARNVYLDIGVV